MLKNKEKAFELRRQKKSYSAISRELGINKSTLASWFKYELWSQEIRDELGRAESLSFPKKLARVQSANKKRWQDWRQQSRNQATEEFILYKDNPLFIAGIMLYWGEGDRSFKNSTVKLANSDPALIKIYCLFLRQILQVPEEKIRVYLLLYPDLAEGVQKNFWSVTTGIPADQFTKSIYIKGKHPTRRLSYGVCNIRISSRQLKEKIMRWIELYPGHFADYRPLKKTTK